MAGVALAQEASSDMQVVQPAEASHEQPAGQQPPPSPGLFGVLGGWIRESADGVASNLKGTQQRIDGINKGAMDTLSRLPAVGMVSGRATCQVALNGGPDCNAASDKLCKDKGYAGGKSLLTESAETCKPRVLIPGYKRKDGDCRVDTFVTRASCN